MIELERLKQRLWDDCERKIQRWKREQQKIIEIKGHGQMFSYLLKEQE